MAEGKFFYITSKLNDLCLDIEHGEMSSGTPIVTWEYHGGDNQLWYIDSIMKVIRSKADDNFVLEIQGV